MAEGFLNALYNTKYEGYSAGIKATKVNPYVIQAMNELGIDISKQRSKSINEFRDENFDLVITVCESAKEICPFFPGKRVLHKNFPDPSKFKGTTETILKQTKKVRDEIRDWIQTFFDNESHEARAQI
jgi:arsenate reductase